jgi:hypothetical protein
MKITAIILALAGGVMCRQAVAQEASEAASNVAPGVSKIAVAQFDAPKGSRARAAVLQTLADHDDIEVVALDDIQFASKRLAADPATKAGRKRLSSELGIGAWIDGKVVDDEARLTLSAADGTHVVEVEVEAPNVRLLDALSGERMWQTMGAHLSVREARRKQLLTLQQSARAKVQARAAEAERQRGIARATLALQAQQGRSFQANNPYGQAQSPFAQVSSPQPAVGQTSAGKGAGKPAARPKNGKKSRDVVAAPLTNTTGWSSQQNGQSIPGWNTPTGRVPVGPTGVSAATQRWLAQQQDAMRAQNGAVFQ